MSVGFIGTLIVGDLNVHHTHWLKFSSHVSVEGTRLLRFCRENGFRQVVKAPTHEAGHLLDLGLTDMAEVETARVLPKIADHNIVRFVLNLGVPAHAPRSDEFTSISEHLGKLYVRIWHFGIGPGIAFLVPIVPRNV